MAVMSYKCPNCGAGLTFDPKTQQLRCEYCLSEFTEEAMKALEAEEAKKEKMEHSGREDEGKPENAWMTAGEAAQNGEDVDESAGSSGLDADSYKEDAVVYMCPSCGAEIVTDATTAATFCYYCHNPVVLSGRVSGEYLPDYVLPFAIDRKKAEEIFINWIGKKKYVPASFYDKNQIEKLSGVYFPYLLYSCQVDGHLKGEGEKETSQVLGNTRHTEHKRYKVERSGSLDVKNLTRNALSKSNKELVEGVLPFETGELVPFQSGYLSGFLAEKRDMESEMFNDEAEQEVRDYTIENLRSSISGYNSLKIQDSETRIRDAKWQYALLPVWVLTYHHKEDKKTYYFAMNGQTGKICGKLPVDKGKLVKLFAGVFAPLFAVLMIGGWFL